MKLHNNSNRDRKIGYVCAIWTAGCFRKYRDESAGLQKQGCKGSKKHRKGIVQGYKWAK